MAVLEAQGITMSRRSMKNGAYEIQVDDKYKARFSKAGRLFDVDISLK